ncbi:MAG: hypothetical protein HYT71_01410 [Candidatus Aenigmarchaeota archaeon]|nr:hypothetical protein [Candidatus Aenigmarchaeota archaeon]
MGIAEYNFALLMGLVIALVMLAVYLGWIKGSGENVERERNQMVAAAGCLADNSCAKLSSDKFCINTYEGKNECGCWAWMGIDGNAGCGPGKRCVSERGTNYGKCV